MELSSKGLGRLVIPLRLDEAEIALTPEHVVLSGTLRAGKVNWAYRVRLDDDDLVRFSRLAERREVIEFLVRERGLGIFGVALRALPAFVGGALRTLVGRGTPVRAPEELPMPPPPPPRPGARRA